MDEKMMVQWSQTAQELDRVWFPSMRSRSRVRLEEGDIRDFLIDLWLEKGGQGTEFDEANRGQLYNYVLLHVGNSRDVLASASLMSEMCASGRGDDEIDEDRFDFLSHSDDDFDQAEQADDELAGLGVTQGEGVSVSDDELDQRLEELAAIRDSGLSSALAEVFGITDRRGRAFSSEIRSEKILALLVDAARKRFLKPSEVKKLAAGIAAEHRKTIARINAAGGGGDLSYSEIEAFEEMMGLVLVKAKPTTPALTATTAKNRLLQAKRQRKPAQVAPKVPQQQSIPKQLELV